MADWLSDLERALPLRRIRHSSLALRLVASAAVWCALLLAGGGFALSALFGDNVKGNFDARLTVLLEALVAGSEVDPGGALDLRLQLGEPRFGQPLSGWYWQINAGNEPLERSASLWDQTLPLERARASLATAPLEAVEIVGPENRRLRLLARAITLPGRVEPLLYAVAGDRGEISAATRRFDRLLSAALALLFLGLLAAVLIQVHYGLRPLTRIRRGLSAIRAGESRRLEGDFPREIRPLAAELNALLDHSEDLVARARTHVGNLAHGLKTPLAVLHNEARRSDGNLAELVTRQVTLMHRHVDHHLTRARTVGTGSVLGARTDLAPILADLRRALTPVYRDSALTIEIDCPPELAFRGASEDLEEIVGNLLDNACKWAGGLVRVTARRADDGDLAVTVEDDGPGLPPDRAAEVLERGRRLDQTKPGSGLGLAIVADVVALYGGELVLRASPLGGLAARVRVPAAPERVSSA